MRETLAAGLRVGGFFSAAPALAVRLDMLTIMGQFTA
jgi:hypothetical protein